VNYFVRTKLFHISCVLDNSLIIFCILYRLALEYTVRYFENIDFYITGSIPVRQLAEFAWCRSESVVTCTWAKPEHLCAPKHVCNSAFTCL
jgi:hypothetical protein